MTLLGEAAVAMWWDIVPSHRAEFEDWHSHEHFPERMSIPGFQRGSRWASAEGGDGFFVMYELESYATLSSPRYLGSLNNPTPWSKKMMPHHRNMVRSQCRIVESFGGGIGRAMMTLRLSPQKGREDSLRQLLNNVLSGLPVRQGVTGAHLLITQTPDLAQTNEQKIRGGDEVADWIVLISGYDAEALGTIAQRELGAEALSAAGTAPAPIYSYFNLAYSVTPSDIRAQSK
ncbi:MAG: hypothetical protein HY242_06890 [Afipia sp.]|nr:hypothetical protein [Afipia sp.]